MWIKYWRATSNVCAVTRVRFLAALLAVSTLLSGCFLLDRDDRSVDDTSPVAWRPCPEVPREIVGVTAPRVTYECATITVPRDWAAPEDSGTFELALIRIRKEGQRDRIGSLVINPGGPGGSGIEAAVLLTFGPLFGGLSDAVTERFDVVGFDPRGVGRSSPVRCSTDEELDESFGADPDPDTDREFEAALEDSRRVAERCGQRYGDVLGYLSTEQTARDMEAIREAVGDEKLTYLGYSYGTLLGAVYAHLYPTRVRAMVLDGAIDPREDPITGSETQAAGFERAFDNFADWCAEAPDECPLRPDARTAVTEALERARTAPLKAEDGRQAGAGWVFLAVLSTLYLRDRWPELARAVDRFNGGDARGIFALADLYTQRRPDGTYPNLFDAHTAINCADGGADVTVEEVRRLQDRWRRKYPLFGPPLAVGLLSCTVWPAQPDPYPSGPAEGAPPILVVGTTGDPATPYEQTADLAELLGVGVVLTYHGEGHTVYPTDRCVTETVDAYLIDLTVPPAGTECP